MKHLLELKSDKKSTELYLRALWGRGFAVRGLAIEDVTSTPLSYLLDDCIHVPEKFLSTGAQTGYYRAAATHAALHISSDAAVFEEAELNFMQRAVIGLVEDLRLELRAIKQFPGLRSLWLGFHNIADNQQVGALQLMLRLSRAVLDPAYQDDHHWVFKGRQRILDSVADSDNSAIAMEVGLSLANDLGQMRLPLNSGKYEQLVAYRDDNRCLWQKVLEHRQQAETPEQQAIAETQQAKFIEADSGIELQLTHSHVQSGNAFCIVEKNGDELVYRQFTSPELIDSRTYPEWDYRSHVLKQDWCRVQEYAGKSGSLAAIDEISHRHKYTLSRLRRMASRLRVEKQQWIRKVEEGEQFDLSYMVDTMIAVRGYMTPDPRVFMHKAQQQEKNLAISILLDLSESTNDIIEGSQQSITQILRDAVFLLAETLSVVGESFAIAGFSSNGRHQVSFTRFKSFEEDFDKSKNRLSGITGSYSTRLGAAIRHSASELALQPERKKLLLVITDGTPSDIDIYDKNYLVQDSWHAVHGLYQYGIRPFCINLDRRSDKVIEHIFGRGKCETLDSVTRLPELLAHLYMRYLRG